MAAGKGTRMRPLTDRIPKPLINVNGQVMIETCIEALKSNGINEIYIVIGYLKEQYSYLCKKYSDITLIENPYYDFCNNISSLYVAKDHLEDVLIMDGDQLIYQSQVLGKYFEISGYNCIWQPERTEEWVLTVDELGKVIHCNPTGGTNCWQLFGISRWTKEDGRKLRQFLITEFEENKHCEIYWDDIPLTLHLEDFSLGIFKMGRDAVKELDDFADLVKLDASYLSYINSGETSL